MERLRKSSPDKSESVDAELWTWERKREGENVVELRRNLFPLEIVSPKPLFGLLLVLM